MALSKDYRHNFNTLLKAAKNDALALMECTDAATGEPRAVLCAVNVVDGEYEMVPFGHLCPGDPYKAYLPPEM
ncbi:MAG: long-chain fatty acid--CoA ligase [Gammaproteobacteria bacterium]|nr:long-chain fatty acid--CoA ligase [Gammaproteobacteria bacterium]